MPRRLNSRLFEGHTFNVYRFLANEDIIQGKVHWSVLDLIQDHGGRLSSRLEQATHFVLPHDAQSIYIKIDEERDYRRMDLEGLVCRHAWLEIEGIGEQPPQDDGVQLVTDDWIEQCVREGRIKRSDKLILGLANNSYPRRQRDSRNGHRDRSPVRASGSSMYHAQRPRSLSPPPRSRSRSRYEGHRSFSSTARHDLPPRARQSSRETDDRRRYTPPSSASYTPRDRDKNVHRHSTPPIPDTTVRREYTDPRRKMPDPITVTRDSTVDVPDRTSRGTAKIDRKQLGPPLTPPLDDSTRSEADPVVRNQEAHGISPPANTSSDSSSSPTRPLEPITPLADGDQVAGQIPTKRKAERLDPRRPITTPRLESQSRSTPRESDINRLSKGLVDNQNPHTPFPPRDHKATKTVHTIQKSRLAQPDHASIADVPQLVERPLVTNLYPTKVVTTTDKILITESGLPLTVYLAPEVPSTTRALLKLMGGVLHNARTATICVLALEKGVLATRETHIDLVRSINGPARAVVSQDWLAECLSHGRMIAVDDWRIVCSPKFNVPFRPTPSPTSPERRYDDSDLDLLDYSEEEDDNGHQDGVGRGEKDGRTAGRVPTAAPYPAKAQKSSLAVGQDGEDGRTAGRVPTVSPCAAKDQKSSLAAEKTPRKTSTLPTPESDDNDDFIEMGDDNDSEDDDESESDFTDYETDVQGDNDDEEATPRVTRSVNKATIQTAANSASTKGQSTPRASSSSVTQGPGSGIKNRRCKQSRPALLIVREEDQAAFDKLREHLSKWKGKGDFTRFRDSLPRAGSRSWDRFWRMYKIPLVRATPALQRPRFKKYL